MENHAAMKPAPDRKPYLGRYTEGEKAYFMTACRKHGIDHKLPHSREEKKRQAAAYSQILAGITREAPKHHPGGELRATDPWPFRKYLTPITTIRVWFREADLCDLTSGTAEERARKAQVLEERISKKEQRLTAERQVAVQAANEHLREQFKAMKILVANKSVC
ncbi:hypothetical protein DSL72_008512 [Monilinia vaccinii-corymbosi]|uniref:Uncharacterized protein n=1 Tax=Monilinia vaccinii-corymbosi TaxID=61207 RepID=A0A8A3PJW7_9HELO|nr:hypothetical protein DSL72_008512 [Monilinia vaccinii-corymbosi]